MPWRKVISRCGDRARQAHVRRFVGWSGRASLIRGHLSQTWRKWKSQPYKYLGRRAFQVASAKFLKWVQCWCIWGRIRRICRWGRRAQKGMSERKYVDMTLGACENDLLIASVSSVRVRMEQKESGIWRDVQLRQWTVNGFEQTVIPGPTASILSGNVLKMQILGPHPRSAESETLEVRANNLDF